MFIVIIFYIFITIITIPDLIRKKYWKDFYVFVFLNFIAFLLGILYALDVNISSPYRAIGYLIKDILHLAYK